MQRGHGGAYTPGSACAAVRDVRTWADLEARFFSFFHKFNEKTNLEKISTLKREKEKSTGQYNDRAVHHEKEKISALHSSVHYDYRRQCKHK